MKPDYEFQSFLFPISVTEPYFDKRKAELASSTLTKEVSHLKSLDQYIVNNALKDLNAESISNWVGSFKTQSHNSINHYIRSARSYLVYANALNGTHYFVPEYKTSVDEYIPHYYSADERKKIYEYIDNLHFRSSTTLPWIAYEIPMIVRVLEGCGTRLGETLSLQMQDVEMKPAVLIIRNAKMDKQRRVPLSDSLASILERYCYAMSIIGNPTAYLFPGKTKDEPLKTYDVSDKFRIILSKLGIRDKALLKNFERGPCIHDLRHTFTIDAFRQLNQQGITLDDTICYLSVYLGHATLTETQAYLKFSAELFPEEIDKFYDEADKLAGKEDKWERWNL